MLSYFKKSPRTVPISQSLKCLSHLPWVKNESHFAVNKSLGVINLASIQSKGKWAMASNHAEEKNNFLGLVFFFFFKKKKKKKRQEQCPL